jgi:hypothetical protein
MNLQQAQRILTRHKEGDVYPQWVINTALYITGDSDEMPQLQCADRSSDEQTQTSQLHLQKKSVF